MFFKALGYVNIGSWGRNRFFLYFCGQNYVLLMIRNLLLIILCLSATSELAQDYYERVDSADIYISRQRWEDAERTLKDALRLEPGNILNSMLLSNLGYVQHSQGKLDEAIESYNIGLAMTPNSLILKKHRANAPSRTRQRP